MAQQMRIDRTQFAPEILGKIHGFAGQHAESDAWRKLIGDQPVSARIELLPETRIRPAAWLTSLLFQTALAVFLVAIPLIFPSSLRTILSYEVTPVATLETQVVLPALQRAGPSRESRPAPLRLLPPEPGLPRRVVFAPAVPRPNTPVQVPAPEAPRIEQSPEVLMLGAPSEPARPREPVKTGVMSTNTNSPAAEPATGLAKVQTGGFGEIGGVPGMLNPDNRSNAVLLGSLDTTGATVTGKNNGTASTIRAGVAGSGFANTVAATPTESSLARGEVKSGGFAAATNGPEAPRPKQSVEALTVEPVVILEKPSPLYTEEARRLGIEGEVQIQVVFLASGSVRVTGVSKGLGHGLDEAATRAALKIHFKPARREGQAVDFPATVRIAFQLAF